jgi:hypothetical protein
MQLRFERRSGFITFQGNYTFSKATDDSTENPVGRGRWLGNNMNRITDGAIGG